MFHPDAIVETKMNNSRLCKATSKIELDGNQYYILMDTAADNPNIIRELSRLKKVAADKKNVLIVDIHSFEYVLLSFEHLIEWVFAEEDELKNKREALIKARELLVEMISIGATAEKLTEMKTIFPYATNHNSEQISGELLLAITRNTGFETDKKRLGECFINSCCEWSVRQNDDICGLNESRLTAEEKKKELLEYSVLKTALAKVGL